LQAQKPEGGVHVGVDKLKVGVIPLGWRSRLQKTRKQHIFVLRIGTDKSLGKNLMMHLKEWTTQQGRKLTMSKQSHRDPVFQSDIPQKRDFIAKVLHIFRCEVLFKHHLDGYLCASPYATKNFTK
jgi:hypothetical protein